MASAIPIAFETSGDLVVKPLSDDRASFPVLRMTSGVAFAGDLAGAPPLGCVWAPFGAADGAAAAPCNLPPRCGACGSFLARDNGAGLLRHVERTVLAWACAFCGRDNDIALTSTREAAELHAAWTRLEADTVDYPPEPWAVVAARGPVAAGGRAENGTAGADVRDAGSERGPAAVAASNRTSFGLGGYGGSGRGAIVVLVDENYRQGDQVDSVVAAVTSIYLKACETERRFALLMFGAAVSAAVVPDQVSQAAAEGAVVLDTITEQQAAKMTVEHKLSYFTGGTSLQARDSPSASRRDQFMSRLFGAAICGRAAGYGLQEPSDRHDLETINIDDGVERLPPHSEPPPRLPADAEPRRLDLAVLVALELIEGVADPESSRILSFVSGIPTLDEPAGANPSVGDVAKSIEEANLPKVTEWSGAVAGGASGVERRDSVAMEPERISTASARSAPTDESQSSWLYSTFSNLLYSATGPAEPERTSETQIDIDVEDSDSVVESGKPTRLALKKRHGGPSSAELRETFEEIGYRAAEGRIPLFFLSYGADDDRGCDIRALYAAASRSRGGMVYSAPHGFPSRESLCTAAVRLANWSITPALISIRVSPPLCVDHVIGPAAETAAPDTFAVTSTDPTTGFAVVLGASAAAQRNATSSDSTVMQLVVKSSVRTRVITLCVAVTDDRMKFIEALDPEAAAIIVAKSEMVKAGGVDAHSYKFAAVLDTCIRKLIAHKPPIATVASLLFGLRRGPLVEAHVGLDEGLVLRSIFQRSECTISSLMMSPRGFYTTTGAGAMAEGAYISDMFSVGNALVVVDAGAIVFAWAGPRADSKVEESVVRSAQEVATGRGLAQCFVVHAGDEMDEVLQGYVTPKSVSVAKSDFDGLEDVPFMSFLEYVALLRRAHAPPRART